MHVAFNIFLQRPSSSAQALQSAKGGPAASSWCLVPRAAGRCPSAQAGCGVWGAMPTADAHNPKTQKKGKEGRRGGRSFFLVPFPFGLRRSRRGTGAPMAWPVGLLLHLKNPLGGRRSYDTADRSHFGQSQRRAAFGQACGAAAPAAETALMGCWK
jgi:hypothetical protein